MKCRGPIRGVWGVVAVVSAVVGLLATPAASPVQIREAGKVPARRPNVLVLISDDHSYPDLSAYGVGSVSTPGIDRLAREGVLFERAFVSTPSCAPSRAALLTGQEFYRLREASMNHGAWPAGLQGYPDRLAAAGYHVGYTGKGWAPGAWQDSGRTVTPTGLPFNERTATAPTTGISANDYAANFDTFLASRPEGAPFCFWAGFSEPHRAYEERSGIRHGIDPASMRVPPFLPDTPDVRADLADYVLEIEHIDRHVARMLETLERRGELDQTIVIFTADNGMPFPRAKATLYDAGTRVPMTIRWRKAGLPGRRVSDFVSLIDVAPTILELAGLEPPTASTGRSLVPILDAVSGGQVDRSRDHVILGIERHFPGNRQDSLGYPIRAIRTDAYLYLRNFAPERSPMGDHPGPVWPVGDPVDGYGDVDGGLSKTLLWNRRAQYPEMFRLAFGTRPGEELYRVDVDPWSLVNVAGDPAYSAAKAGLARELETHLVRTADPRAMGRGAALDEVARRFPHESR